MKKHYSLFVLCFLLIGYTSFSQTFSFTQIDAAKYGNPGDELICSSTLVNNTANAISMRVGREQNVIGEAADWTSAFCMDVCYLPGTDSVSYTFQPMDTVNFTFHFYTSSTTPDHATAKMKFRNTTTPSNTFTATFFGSTDGAMADINDFAANAFTVNVYPMPIVSGDVFSMNVSTAKTQSTISLVIYNMFGGVVGTSSLSSGINLMNLDLPAGVYAYSLTSGNVPIHSGKLAVSK